MMLLAYSVLDTKTGAYGVPFFVHHDAMAYRMIFEASQDNRTQLAKHPADFCLIKIGAFDDDRGVLENYAPTNLGSVAAISGRMSQTVQVEEV